MFWAIPLIASQVLGSIGQDNARRNDLFNQLNQKPEFEEDPKIPGGLSRLLPPDVLTQMAFGSDNPRMTPPTPPSPIATAYDDIDINSGATSELVHSPFPNMTDTKKGLGGFGKMVGKEILSSLIANALAPRQQVSYTAPVFR